MEHQLIPEITITSPTGERLPVFLFPFPGQGPETHTREWFAEQLAEPQGKPETKDLSFGIYHSNLWRKHGS
ncbi:unnamed protein product [Fusarium graminearum]|nr:unnamed protein product [Fusarium graminearum]